MKIAGWMRRFAMLLRLGSFERELDEEMRFHRELRERELRDRGMDADSAQRASRKQFGNETLLKEQSRGAWGWTGIESLLRDCAYGWRSLRKSPSVALVAMLTLALGIGANTTIFSIVEGVLLKPLPYPESQELVVVARTSPRFDHPVPVSGPNFLDWRSRARQFDSLAGFDGRSFAVMIGNEARQVIGAAISPSFFSVLKVTPTLGRGFLPEEERSGSNRVVVVSNGFWKEELGGDPSVVGRILTVNGRSFAIVGVLPASFRYVLMPRAEIFIPLSLEQTDRGYNFLNVIGRLKAGVTPDGAQGEMDAIARALEKEYPKDNAEQGAVVSPMLTRVGRLVHTALMILLGSVGLVLLIACANVGNLLIAQGIRRQAEIGIRAALGAGTGRLARQCLVESALLGLAGGVTGIALGYGGLRAFQAMSPGNVPRLGEVEIDARVMLFSFGIAMAASLLFGLLPAMQVRRLNLAGTLKEVGSRTSVGTQGGLARQALVVGEVALSLVLLSGAGLAMRSFLKMVSTNPGYDPRNVLTFWLSPNVRKGAQAAEFFRAVQERATLVPGVMSVGLAKSIPPGDGEVDGPVITSEHPDLEPNRAPNIVFNPITPSYFRTMRLSLLAGREFSASDVAGAPGVAILNEAAARSLFPEKSAIGRQIKLGDNTTPWLTVVGVVIDERFFGWDSDRTPTAYLPLWQTLADGLPDYDSGVVVRTGRDPLSFVPAMRSVVASVDRQTALLGPETMEERMTSTFAPHRFQMILLGSFAGLALILAAVGVYGVMAQFVESRTREIGIRVAMGAQTREVLTLVLRQGVKLTLAGAAVGAVGVAATTRLLRAVLYGVEPDDPATLLFVTSILLLTAMLACYLPARRATRVDPIQALRFE